MHPDCARGRHLPLVDRERFRAHADPMWKDFGNCPRCSRGPQPATTPTYPERPRMESTLSPPAVQRDPLRPGADEVVSCPLCDADIDVRVSAFGSQVDDVEIASAPCGHDRDPLIVEDLFIQRVQELGRAAYLRRFE